MYKSFLICLVAALNSESVESFGSQQQRGATTTPMRRSHRLPLAAATIGSSSLGYRHGNEDFDTVAFVPPMSQHQQSNVVAIDPKDLPRHSPPAAVVEREKLLWDAELITGRVAMVAAVLLLGGEVVSGLSISDQLMNLL
jgi:hypothetical protein